MIPPPQRRSTIGALSRRAFLAAGPALLAGRAATQSGSMSSLQFGMPMGLPDRVPGDGCYIRHGYACENTGFNTGWWHTGENWYLIEGNSAGALVLAVAGGEVVYAESDYPGRVVIVLHARGLYSMYGHLDYDLPVAVGDSVELGQVLGTVLFRTDTRSPSHLHLELRTFLTTPIINGASPRYNFACGAQCPPGPGYWPMSDPDHPSTLGWLNPVHVIGQRMFPNEIDPFAEVVVASSPSALSRSFWSAPADQSGAERLDEMLLIPGQRFPLLAIESGDEGSTGTSAEAYRLWYEIETLDGVHGWVSAIQPSFDATGTDGRPSAVKFDFLLDTA